MAGLSGRMTVTVVQMTTLFRGTALSTCAMKRQITLTRAMLRKWILAVSGCMRLSVASSMARRLTRPPPAMYCSTRSARVLRGSSMTCAARVRALGRVWVWVWIQSRVRMRMLRD